MSSPMMKRIFGFGSAIVCTSLKKAILEELSCLSGELPSLHYERFGPME
jgi:hypothetical protein